MEATPTTAAAATPVLSLLERSKPGGCLAERLAVAGRRRLRERHAGQAERYGNQCSKNGSAHTLILSSSLERYILVDTDPKMQRLSRCRNLDRIPLRACCDERFLQP
jgi:hypothetical protein